MNVWIRLMVPAALLACASAAAQNYPVKPARAIVAFAAGGDTDT